MSGEVTVNPLVWVPASFGGDTYYANTILGQYAVWGGYFRSPYGSVAVNGDERAAAQAHHDAELFSALTIHSADPLSDPRVVALVEALNGCIAAIEHANMADGVCCCGDDMECHSEPMNCGHSPVDQGEYHAHQVLTAARVALRAIGGTP